MFRFGEKGESRLLHLRAGLQHQIELQQAEREGLEQNLREFLGAVSLGFGR